MENKGVLTAAIYIEPHERQEALEAYRDRLTNEQVEQIEDAPDGALVQLTIIGPGVLVTVIEEG